MIALLPEPMRRWLPTQKQYFRTALAATTEAPLVADRSIAAGVIDPDALSADPDTARLMAVRALENWLAGAERAGAAIPGVCTAATRMTISPAGTR